jgi:orotidine-5'-phosphate decarboxylase
MLNVHALGGERMLTAAREAVDAAEHPPLLIAVTILTSMAAPDLAGVGLQGDPEDNVLRLASLAHYCGLDGIVCSSREARIMRQTFDEPFRLITPGIRPAGSAADDQRRVMTPAEAIRNGSTYLVIGRPVTAADDPTAVLRRINSELAALS